MTGRPFTVSSSVSAAGSRSRVAMGSGGQALAAGQIGEATAEQGEAHVTAVGGGGADIVDGRERCEAALVDNPLQSGRRTAPVRRLSSSGRRMAVGAQAPTATPAFTMRSPSTSSANAAMTIEITR